jgi:hypothetical protein
LPYPPPGEAPDGRPVTPHGLLAHFWKKIHAYLPSLNDESTGSFICLRRHIYMSHVLLLHI